MSIDSKAADDGEDGAGGGWFGGRDGAFEKEIWGGWRAQFDSTNSCVQANNTLYDHTVCRAPEESRMVELSNTSD